MVQEESNQVVPILIGVAVIVGLVVYELYFSKRKGSDKKSKKILLKSSTEKYTLPLIEKEEISHDTRRFRFKLPTPDCVLGLPIGQHINISAKVGDDLVIRSYTPVSSDKDHGFLDLIIKVYFKNVHPRFPEGGKMSQHLESLKIGDTIEIRGPSGRIQYTGRGTFSIKKLRKDPAQTVVVKEISMIAGGTGITPMLQLIRHITEDPDDDTKLSLLFANQTEKDILVRKELEEVRDKYGDQFKLWYTLDTPGDSWKYSSGFINADLIKKHLFPPSTETVVLMCGPPPMVNFACLPSLEQLNYSKDQCVVY